MKAIAGVYVVLQGEAGERLDKWLFMKLQEEEYDISRNHVQDWITSGFVTGGKTRLKSSDTVLPGEQFIIQVPADGPVEIGGDEIPLSIVYEDEDVVVVDKPRGLVVHPGAGHARGTLINGLVYRGTKLSELGGQMRPGVVHRIDKDTSGLVMFAKTDKAYYGLSGQLKDHTVIRSYIAIVHGVLTHDEGTIDAPVGRDPHNRQRMAVVETGKPAVTHFYVSERFPEYTIVSCRLETGRTHQIRVHFAYIGHPLAGDGVYGRRKTLAISGQALHAKTLGFVHPGTDENLLFESNLPEDMTKLIDGLQRGDL
jgi:23S rRNA pseudouridine1911/1915/1917 synthase